MKPRLIATIRDFGTSNPLFLFAVKSAGEKVIFAGNHDIYEKASNLQSISIHAEGEDLDYDEMIINGNVIGLGPVLNDIRMALSFYTAPLVPVGTSDYYFKIQLRPDVLEVWNYDE